MMTWVKRSPMTVKKSRAIHAYVAEACRGNMTLGAVIEYTLHAERMPAHDLYLWLEQRGYRWRSHSRVWAKNERAG